VNQALVKLYRLQNIDREILERESMIKEIPLKTKELESQFKAKKEILEEIRQRLTENKNMESGADKKLQESRLAIAKYKKQLLIVKTNKEYSALLMEISREEKKVEVLEEEIIALLDKIEGIEEEEREEKMEVEKTEKNYLEKKEKLEGSRARFLSEIGDKKIEREKAIADIDSNLLKRYEKIRYFRDGIAVVRIIGENCGGCFTTIPPQVINEAKKGDKILTCENCGRILVYIEEGKDINEG